LIYIIDGKLFVNLATDLLIDNFGDKFLAINIDRLNLLIS